MSQAVSLIFNGVLDRYPDLRVILIEGGFTYVPHLIWTADQRYARSCGTRSRGSSARPGRIIREQVRLASQPTVEMTSAQLETLIGQMGSDELDLLLERLSALGLRLAARGAAARAARGPGAQDLPRQRARHFPRRLPVPVGVRVCAAGELAPGQMIGATLGHAADRRCCAPARASSRGYVDRCLHQGARLSGGRMLEAMDGDAVGDYRPGDGDVLKCPWHGYESNARSRRLRAVRPVGAGCARCACAGRTAGSWGARVGVSAASRTSATPRHSSSSTAGC